MANKSMIAREVKRIKTVEKYVKIRAWDDLRKNEIARRCLFGDLLSAFK